MTFGREKICGIRAIYGTPTPITILAPHSISFAKHIIFFHLA